MSNKNYVPPGRPWGYKRFLYSLGPSEFSDTENDTWWYDDVYWLELCVSDVVPKHAALSMTLYKVNPDAEIEGQNVPDLEPKPYNSEIIFQETMMDLDVLRDIRNFCNYVLSSENEGERDSDPKAKPKLR